MATRAKRITYKTKEAAAAAIGITVAVLDVIGHITYRVYQEIGADLAEVNGGRPMKRAEVIEVSLDAGRPEQLLKQERARAEKAGRPVADIDSAIAVLHDWQNYGKVEAAMKLYFSFAYYE
jgi:hypothetical protein